jgi:hypothetical protein
MQTLTFSSSLKLVMRPHHEINLSGCMVFEKSEKMSMPQCLKKAVYLKHAGSAGSAGKRMQRRQRRQT